MIVSLDGPETCPSLHISFSMVCYGRNWFDHWLTCHHKLHKDSSVVANADHGPQWKGMGTLFAVTSPSPYSILSSSLVPWEWFLSLPFWLLGEALCLIFVVFWSYIYTLSFRDTSAKLGLNTYNRAKAGAVPTSVWKFFVVVFLSIPK